MFQQLAIAAFIKMACIALCKFFDICICEDECPDGVCDKAYDALEDLSSSVADPVSNPSKVKGVDFDIDWTKLQEVVDAAVVLINALKAFLGLNKVG